MPPRWGLGCFHGAAGYKHAVPPELGETVLKQDHPELRQERHDPGDRECTCRPAGAWNVFMAQRTIKMPFLWKLELSTPCRIRWPGNFVLEAQTL